jgi:hypothetical protein
MEPRAVRPRRFPRKPIESKTPLTDFLNRRPTICNAAWTLRGVGFAFCRLPYEHAGGCELHNWDGDIYALVGGEYQRTGEHIPTWIETLSAERKLKQEANPA